MSTALVPYRAPRMPVERQLVRRADRALPDYLKEEDFDEILKAAETPRERMLVLALWNTGGRVREVLALRRCDFDPRGLCLTMANEKQRQKDAEKAVYIGQAFALELLAYCEAEGFRGTDYLFPSRQSRQMNRSTAWRIVHKLGTKANVAAWPHLFRHGNAVHLLRNGVPLPAVQSQLGHASVLTTMVYTKLSADDIRHFISKVEF